MEFPTTLKTFSALLASASLGGFFGAYLAPPPAVPESPVLDTRALEAVSAKLEISAKQFAELQQIYQTLASATENQKNDFSQLQQSWLARLESLESKLDKLASVNLPPVVSPVPAVTAEQSGQFEKLAEQLDYDGLQDVIRDMHSEDFNARQRALRVLALVGASEIKKEIGRIILDETQDLALRRDLITSMDWQGLGEQLISLFENSKDSVIRAAAISAVDTSRLDETEKQAFETSIINNFSNESDDFVRISTLDYFANHDSPHLHSLADSLNGQDISSQLREHIRFLTTPAPQAPLEEIPPG